ncbi:MAG: glycosyl transferase family 2 [Acidobacteria bacterium]|nr:glycosyl transferase family 2 [Acidobacteriota bacterium]
MDRKKLLSIIVPVYNECEVIRTFYDRVKKVGDALASLDYEVIFVDDGSCDGSYPILTKLADEDSKIVVVKLSRNFGHQMAITAGMDAARGDAVVIIDADLQDPPEVIPEFVDKWRQGFDVVYGVREKREGEGRLKLLTASAYYRVLRMLTRIDIPIDAGDFRLMARRVVEQLKRLTEKERFVRGLVSWVGFRQMGVVYRRDRRYGGETKYPYGKMIKFALDGITSFSTIPLRLSTWLGYLSSTFAFLYACSVFVQKALGYTVQGWATIMVGVLFLGGVQLICLGIIGEYIGRIYEESKRRPLYIVENVYGQTWTAISAATASEPARQLSNNGKNG